MPKKNNFGVYIETPITHSKWKDSGVITPDNAINTLHVGTILHSDRRHYYIENDYNKWKEWEKWYKEKRIQEYLERQEAQRLAAEAEAKRIAAINYTYPPRDWIKSDKDLSKLSTSQLSMGTIISQDGQYIMFVEPDEWEKWKNWYEHQPHIRKQNMQQSIESLKNIIEIRTSLLHERMIQEAEYLIELKEEEIQKAKNKERALKAKKTKDRNKKEEKKLEEQIKKSEKEKAELQKKQRELRAANRLNKFK